MKTKRCCKWIVVFLALCLFAVLPSMAGTTQKVLKLGSIMPFSGPYGVYGDALRPGMDIYVELLNEDGGVKIGDDTYKIEMHYADDAIDPKKGPIAAQRLIQEGVVAVVGTFSILDPIAAVLTPAKKLFVVMMQGNLDLKKHKYVIGGLSGWGLSEYGTYAALDMWPGVKKMGFLWYDWQGVVLNQVIEEMKKPGKPYRDLELLKEFQVMGDMDYTTPLAKFKKAGVDVVNLGVGPADWAVILKTAAELDYHPQYYNAGTLLNVDEFIDLSGEKLAQGIAFNSPNPLLLKKQQVKQENLEMVRRILKRYKEKYGKEMTYFGGFDYGIGMTKVVLEFYKQAGTLDPDKVMEKVRGGTVSDFTGTWKMGGQKVWGAPVVKGSACEVGVIKGRAIVYGGEYAMPPIQ